MPRSQESEEDTQGSGWDEESSKPLSNDGGSTDPDHLMDEVELARSGQRKAELKLDLARRIHEEELNFLNEFNNEDLSKNRGYMEFLKVLNKRKDIDTSRADHTKREIEHLKEKLNDYKERWEKAEKQKKEYQDKYYMLKQTTDQLHTPDRSQIRLSGQNRSPDGSSVFMSNLENPEIFEPPPLQKDQDYS